MSSLGSPRILDVNLLLYGTMLPIRLNAHTGRPGIHAMFPTNWANLLDYLEPANQPRSCDTPQPDNKEEDIAFLLHSFYFNYSILYVLIVLIFQIFADFL